MSTKKECCIVLAATEDLLFSAGTLLANLRAVPIGLSPDFVVFVDKINDKDRAALELICPGVSIRQYQIPDEYRFHDQPVQGAWHIRNSTMGFSRFECFLLLQDYSNVLWLDTDIVVRGDLSPLIHWGQGTSGIRIIRQHRGVLGENFSEAVPGYDMRAPTRNTGVFVISDRLAEPLVYRDWLYRKAAETAPIRKGGDQGVINLLIQHFGLVVDETSQKYNYFCHYAGSREQPCALDDVVVAHSASRVAKYWTNLETLSHFPEWLVYYHQWLLAGGTPFRGRNDAMRYSRFLLEEQLRLLAPKRKKKAVSGRLARLLELFDRLVRTMTGFEVARTVKATNFRLMQLSVDQALFSALQKLPRSPD